MGHELEGAKRILVINFKYLGDSLWMLPFLDNLRQNCPEARVAVAVNEGTEVFFRGHGAVDELFPFPRGARGALRSTFAYIGRLRSFKPEVAIDLSDTDRPAIFSFLSGACRRVGYNNENDWRRHLYNRIITAKIGRRHMVDYHLDVLRELGLTVFDDTLRLFVEPSASKRLREKYPAVFAASLPGQKKILIHPGARGPLRQWPPTRYAALADALTADCQVFLTTGPGEGKIVEQILAAMRTQPTLTLPALALPEFAALCEQVDLFIGNDSGPIHIAAAKTFVVGLYGPTLPDLVSPWTPNKLIINGASPPCRPCRQDGCQNEVFNLCLRSIGADEVIQAVRDLLGRWKWQR